MGWCEGKSVFITGASAGIGAALAREFARRGARVALAARRLDRLAKVQEGIAAAGGDALAVQCDVTDRASLDRAVARAADAFGGLDVAVANAGFGVSGPFEKLSTEDYRRQFDTNVFGLMDTTYAVLPLLRQSKGRLALVSSVMGRVATPSTSAYCSSKFAVCGLAESLYYELAERGVSVTCIEPGLVESDFRMTDNRGVYHEGLEDPATTWLVMPSDKAARAMVRAIGRRRFEAIVTNHGKLIVFMNRHFPRTVRLLMRLATKGRMARIEKRKRARPSS
ncbi:MAG: SDR family NAD(P)-dependent oxidoreductase [Candidatus Hydrogenedentes bacterium]|nr:SDR family NAD(P)-dependent oxidoreductase [Candidatus Hydrogenedentota bacterium]